MFGCLLLFLVLLLFVESFWMRFVCIGVSSGLVYNDYVNYHNETNRSIKHVDEVIKKIDEKFPRLQDLEENPGSLNEARQIQGSQERGTKRPLCLQKKGKEKSKDKS